MSYNIEKHGDLRAAITEIVERRGKEESPAELLRPVIQQWINAERARLGMDGAPVPDRVPGPPYGVSPIRFKGTEAVEYEWSCARCAGWQRGYSKRYAAREGYRTHACADEVEVAQPA